jgi:hypothetical protein
VAVKVTDAPEQIVVPTFEAILTDGVTLLLTVIFSVELVAVVGDTQLALLVIITFTVCPLVKLVVV